MKTRFIALATTCLAASVIASIAARAATPGPEAQKISVWFGDWTYSGQNFGSPFGQASNFTGTMTGRPIQNGFAGEFISTEMGPTGTVRYHEIDFWDARAKTYAYCVIGDDGFTERGSFTWDGNTVKWEKSATAGGTIYRIRGTETIAPDGSSYTRDTHYSADGYTWTPLSHAVFTKGSSMPANSPSSLSMEMN